MFFFGTPEDQATIYWNDAINVDGPSVPDAPLDEMTVEELRNVLVYARIAYTKAKEDGAPSSTLDILLEEHDTAFQALAYADEWFKGLILGTNPGVHVWLNGFNDSNIQKYKDLASAS